MSPETRIAWTAHPVSATPGEPVSPPPDLAPCDPAALAMRARFAAPVVGMNTPVSGLLFVTNSGKTRCHVQTKVAWWVGAKPSDVGATMELGPPALLAPGDVAVSPLTWWGQQCSGTAPLDSIHVSFFGNERIPDRDVKTEGLQRGPCLRPSGDLGSGSWAYTVSRTDWYYPAGVLYRLAAALVDVPASVSGGSTVRFGLVLTNITSEAAVFDHSHPAGATVSCPVVSFGIGDFDPQRHELACDQARTIAPGESVRYDLELVAPAGGVEPITSLNLWFDALPSPPIGSSIIIA